MGISKSEIRKLSKVRSKLAISIYLKIEQGSAGLQKNRIHLKNTLRELIERAEKVGYKKADLKPIADQILSKVTAEDKFIKGDGRSIVIFADENHIKTYYLHTEFEEQYYVGIEFITLPLRRALENDKRYMVLALSQGNTRLYEMSMSDIREVRLKDLPKAFYIDEKDSNIQGHRAGNLSSGTLEAIHGQGGIKDSKKKQLVEYCRKVDAVINKHLKHRGLPLILFAVDYIQPIYKKISSYPKLITQSLVGSPDKIDPYELHRKVLSESAEFSDTNQRIARAYA